MSNTNCNCFINDFESIDRVKILREMDEQSNSLILKKMEQAKILELRKAEIKAWFLNIIPEQTNFTYPIVLEDDDVMKDWQYIDNTEGSIIL